MSAKSAAGFQISVSGMGLSCLQHVKAALQGGLHVLEVRIDFDPITLVVMIRKYIEDPADARKIVADAAHDALNAGAFQTFMENMEVVEPQANA